MVLSFEDSRCVCAFFFKFAWSAWRLFTSVPACDQFGCSGFPPSDANFGKGEALPLKVNVKIFQPLQLLKFLAKSYETFRLWWLHYCALNLKVWAKILTSLLKNWTLNICPVQIQWSLTKRMYWLLKIADSANDLCTVYLLQIGDL